MWKIIPYSLAQCLLLSGGQVLLKLALQEMGNFSWTMEFWKRLFTNWHFCACGACFGIATMLWMYILKHFPFSVAFSLMSLTYVFGMIAAVVVLKEESSLSRWIGVCLIVGGCYFIVK